MKKIILTLLLMATSCFISIKVHAELVDNGSYTSDTASGLDWLDLTETRGLSYNTVLAQMNSGGRFDGWTYATREQVNGLLSHAVFVKGLKTSINILSMSRLLNLWGVTRLR